MEEPFWPNAARFFATEAARDYELDRLLQEHPELEGLEPYSIEWEFIWPM